MRLKISLRCWRTDSHPRFDYCGCGAFHLGRDVSVLPAYNTTAPSDLTGQPLVPRVTVVVDSVLPVQSATGIALECDGYFG